MKLHALTLGKNADGSIELFGLTGWPSNQSIWHRWQTTGNYWSPWTLFGGRDLHRLVSTQNKDGRQEVLALGEDMKVYHKWQIKPNDGWSQWASLDGRPARELVAESNADGRLEVFAVEPETGRVKHCWQGNPNGTWGGWMDLSNTQSHFNKLAAGVNADGRIEVFATQSDGSIHHSWQLSPNGSWSQWVNLGGKSEGSDGMSVAPDHSGRLNLFTGFGDVMQIAQTGPNGGWGTWTNHGKPGGHASYKINSVKNEDGRLEVFALTAPEGDIYHMWQISPDGYWSPWVSMGASDVDYITCGKDNKGCIHLFAIGGDGRVYKISQAEANGSWGSWISMGNPFSYDALPESASDEAKRLAIVFDFDKDSCYPSPALSVDGIPNPGLNPRSTRLLTITEGCRKQEQLKNSNTYYRKVSVYKNGIEYSVHMYALYFMKDKTVYGPGDSGHRHDWEFGLVWTRNGELTHASYSAHKDVVLRHRSELHFDSVAPDTVKIVYHKQAGTTHCMRFAQRNEKAENHLGRWFTPSIVDWHTMTSVSLTNQDLRKIFNEHDFGQANCQFSDPKFASRITHSIPDSYPSAQEWIHAIENQQSAQ